MPTRRATDVLVIGGGMTGAGVLRDLAMRGIRALLVDRGDAAPAGEALPREPLLNPRVARAFAVRDAAADSFLSVETNLRSARAHGGEALSYHRVRSLVREGARVVGARVEDRRTGEEVTV